MAKGDFGRVGVPTEGIDFWRGLQGHFGRIKAILRVYFLILRVFLATFPQLWESQLANVGLFRQLRKSSSWLAFFIKDSFCAAGRGIRLHAVERWAGKVTLIIMDVATRFN